MDASSKPRSPSRLARYECLALVCLPIILIACGIYGAYTSVQAEKNLHATLYVIRLVDEFVQQRGRWPRSWEELEEITFPSEVPKAVERGNATIFIGGAMGFNWPQQSPELQDRVVIDFSASPEEVIEASPVDFQPIRPNGLFYAYWKYGFIEHLQDSLKTATTASAIDARR